MGTEEKENNRLQIKLIEICSKHGIPQGIKETFMKDLLLSSLLSSIGELNYNLHEFIYKCKISLRNTTEKLRQEALAQKRLTKKGIGIKLKRGRKSSPAIMLLWSYVAMDYFKATGIYPIKGFDRNDQNIEKGFTALFQDVCDVLLKQNSRAHNLTRKAIKYVNAQYAPHNIQCPRCKSNEYRGYHLKSQGKTKAGDRKYKCLKCQYEFSLRTHFKKNILPLIEKKPRKKFNPSQR